jgi:hypothetical protein
MGGSRKMTTSSEIWRPPPEFNQQCLDLYGLECPPLWGTPRRPDFPTLGGKAAKVMRSLGFEPMPWQQYVLDVGLEIDPETGLFAHREVGLSVPRQQGKTQQVLAVMTHRIIAWTRQNVTYAAQTRGMARTRFEDEFLPTLDASKLASKYRTRMTNGNEAIIWKSTRSKFGITSNTEKAGHGPPLDLGVIDEAFAHEDDRLEQAMSPAMATRAMGQLWWASAGGTEKSLFLNKKRLQGRELVQQLWETGRFPRAAYFEWFAPDDLPRDDPATWRTCMPALGYTITESTIRADLDRMDDAEFDRAYLNRTKKALPPPDLNVPTKEWPARVDVSSRRGEELAFAVDVTPDRSRSSIAVYSVREDGYEHMELIDYRPGTNWVPRRLLTLRERWDPVAIGIDVVGAPAATLLRELEDVGICKPAEPERPDRGDLAIPTAAEYAAACGQWTDSVRQGRARHIDQTELNTAVAGARSRPLVDSYAWKRTASRVDISPLVAVTLARWAFELRAPIVEDANYDLMDSIGF